MDEDFSFFVRKYDNLHYLCLENALGLVLLLLFLEPILQHLHLLVNLFFALRPRAIQLFACVPRFLILIFLKLSACVDEFASHELLVFRHTLEAIRHCHVEPIVQIQCLAFGGRNCVEGFEKNSTLDSGLGDSDLYPDKTIPCAEPHESSK